MTSPVTAQLILIQGDANNSFQQVIELHDRNQTIGRAQTSDIIWSSLQISRRHATLEYRSQKWFIIDLSTNGLTVNSMKLTKGEPQMLKDADIISFIPTGAVRYRFRYCNTNSPIASTHPTSRPLQASSISQVNIAIPSASSHESRSRVSIEEVMVEDDDSRSDSEESNRSESLLSVDPPDDNDEFLSFSGDEHCPGFGFKRKHKIESSDSDTGVVDKKKKKRVATLDLDSSDDDSHPCTSSKSKTTGSAPGSSSASKLKSLHNWLMTDVEISNCADVKILQKQLRLCSEKLSGAEVKLRALECERDMEREEFRRKESNVKSVNAAFKEETYKKVLELMESELSCSVCNEIFIQATVVDCGHTFCNFCINEWARKKSECPICRKAFRNKSRHIEMENYITRIFDSLSAEISQKRKTSIKEREEQAKKAAAEAAQQAIPGPARANAYNVMQTTGRYIDFLAELHQINEILAPRPGRTNRRRSARIQDRDPAAAPAPPAEGGAPRGRRRGRNNAVVAAAAAPAPPVVPPRAQANTRQNVPIPVVTLNDTQNDEGAGRLPFSNNANHNINQFINPLNWFGY